MSVSAVSCNFFVFFHCRFRWLCVSHEKLKNSFPWIDVSVSTSSKLPHNIIISYKKKAMNRWCKRRKKQRNTYWKLVKWITLFISFHWEDLKPSIIRLFHAHATYRYHKNRINHSVASKLVMNQRLSLHNHVSQA